MNEFVVFDFDKTIISKDSYQDFLFWLIRQSLFRTTIVFLIFPVVFALFHIEATSLFAINLMSKIAFSFQNENIFKLRRRFLNYFFSSGGCVFFKEAKETIDYHRDHGKKVMVVSGCPQWLLRGALKHIGLKNCQSVGSMQVIINGSPKIVDYCYSTNKVKMAQSKCFNIDYWSYGYSDSLSDLPLLKLCNKQYIVNPSPKKEKVFKQNLGSSCGFVKWSCIA